jgi:hypothetical protein
VQRPCCPGRRRIAVHQPEDDHLAENRPLPALRFDPTPIGLGQGTFGRRTAIEKLAGKGIEKIAEGTRAESTVEHPKSFAQQIRLLLVEIVRQ